MKNYKNCQSCNQPFSGRIDAKTCSVKCRKQLQRTHQIQASEVGASWLYVLALIVLLGTVGLQMLANKHLHQNLNNQMSQTTSLKDHQALASKTDQLQLQIQSLQASTQGRQGPTGPQGPQGERGPAGANGQNGTKGEPGVGIPLTSVSDSLLSSNVTLQGNSFNQANQLIKLDNNGLMPALDGSKLTNVNATTFGSQSSTYYTNADNISSGTLNDSRLSANVALLNADQTDSGKKTFANDVLFSSSGAFANGSSTAFQVQNTAGVNIIAVDNTTTGNNLINDNNFETGLGNWINAPGYAPGFGMTNTQAYIGSRSLAITTTTGAGGAGYPITLLPNTTYTFSVYAKSSGPTFSTFSMGYDDSGIASPCVLGVTVSSVSWSRYTCTFTSDSTPNGYVYAQDTSGSHTFYLDAAQLERGSAATTYGGGSLSIGSTISSSIVLEPYADSLSLFQVQNSAGNSLFDIDSVNSRVIINSPSSSSPTLLMLGVGGPIDPVGCLSGEIYYNSTIGLGFRGCVNGSWIGLGTPTADTVSVYNSGSSPTTSGVNTTMNFDTESDDSNNLHNNTKPSRLTAATAGKYDIFGQVQWQSSAAGGYRSLMVILNGTTVIAETDTAAISGLKMNQNVNIQHYLNAGDYIELVVFQNTGASLNLTPASAPQFGMTYLRN